MDSSTARRGSVRRSTAETDISATLALDGQGEAVVSSGIGFFDHMLTALAKHGRFDLEIQCAGDLHVDQHHTVEDLGICLGQAFAKAIGDGQGIHRFGDAFVPMDEALVHAVVDISGRGYLALALDLPQSTVGSFECCLVEEFMRAFALQAGVTLHIRQIAGRNAHHIIEAAFKSLARALWAASSRDETSSGVLSTKGMLDLGKEERP